MRLRNPKLAEYIFDLKLQEMTEYLSEHWTAENMLTLWIEQALLL